MKIASLPLQRREFITLLTPPPPRGHSRRARSSASARAHRRAHALATDDLEGQARLAVFMKALQQLGWADGHNVRIDYRWKAGDANNMRNFAAELVALAPDVILANTSRAVAPIISPSGFYLALRATPWST